MTLPNWGQQEKAQDNPQTIDQAIAAAIAAHEADPTAHLGVGESLEQHKSFEIIDHPAQSVVLDKTPFQDYEEFLGDLGSHNWSNEQGSWDINNDTTVSASLFSQTQFIAVSNLPHKSGANYPNSDLMYQFRLQLGWAGSADGNLAFGFTNDTLLGGARMLFQKDGTNWYFRIYSATALVHEYQLPAGNVLNKYYRIYWDSVNQQIVLYIGTTVATTFATANWKDYIFNSNQVDMSRTTNQSMSFLMTDWKATFAIDTDI